MDDDDDERITTSLLYCHEEPLLSTPPPPSPPAAAAAAGAAAVVVVGGEEEVVAEYVARQRCYAPTTGYLHHLLADQQQQPPVSASSHHGGGVSTARAKALHYILYAFGRLGLAVATAFNAVNYLDRFLSINCHLRWEAWMVELVSVACLSIACKLDEVNIPSLHHLQMEEVLSHQFRPSTIREMELTLLKALQWRLACVTPYSFLQLLLPHCCTTAAAASRCTRLLIRSLSEPSLLRFDSSVIASSALQCLALQDHHQADVSCHITRLIRPECPLDRDASECLEMMKSLCRSLDLSNNQMYSDQQWSPVSAVPFQTDGTVNRSAVTRCLFGRSIPDSREEENNNTSPHTQEMK